MSLSDMVMQIPGAPKSPPKRGLAWRYRLSAALRHLNWRSQTRGSGLVEAICPHGVGHPMVESVRLLDQNGPPGSRGTWGIHGCDGCCAALREAEVAVGSVRKYRKRNNSSGAVR